MRVSEKSVGYRGTRNGQREVLRRGAGYFDEACRAGRRGMP